MIGWMKLAIEEARVGIKAGHGGPFGAVVVCDGKVVGKGHNEVVHRKDPTAHAEVLAIREAAETLSTFDLSGCTLFTTCAPCPMCLGAIQWARIGRVYYGCTAADAEEIGFDDARFQDEKPEMLPLEREACLEVFDQYAAMPDRKRY